MMVLNVDSFATPAAFASTPSGTAASGGSSGGDQQSAGSFGDQLQQALQTSSPSDAAPSAPADQLQLSDNSPGAANGWTPAANPQSVSGNASTSTPSNPPASSSPANLAAASSTTNTGSGTSASPTSDTPTSTTLSSGQSSKPQPAVKEQINNLPQQLGVGLQWQPSLATSAVEQQHPATTQTTAAAQPAQTPADATPAADPANPGLSLNALASQNAVATSDNTGPGKPGAAQAPAGSQAVAAPQAAATPETTIATVQPATAGRATATTATTVSIAAPQHLSTTPTPAGAENTTTTATIGSATTTTTGVTAAQPAPASEKRAAGADQSQTNASLTAPPAAIAAQFSGPLAAANATALTAATTSVAVSALNQAAPAAAADSKADKGSGATGPSGAATPPNSASVTSAAAQAQGSIAGSPTNAASSAGYQASTSGANYSQSGYGPGGTDSARFVQRVANAFQALGNQSGPLKLRLSPPELGSLHVEVRVDQGQLTARVQAETPEARTMLLDNLPALRERLEQQDIKVARFDVDLMGQSSGGLPNTPNRDAWAGYNTQTGGTNRTAAAASVDTSQASSTGSPAVISDSQLNVVI